ncbi:tRNA preQ1(34) S-adenosylmethionine ribosyltransferase-isomerase QueA [Candidatus Peregrinibacteria bacterium]|jgi:S-adenosylmethionine:tRNA ribosyltransferase-isomerase|nr:tRNA preQ1(34) S-adenosylmethionine ribosyltransferase-isomerase QueA [Candidatus Peregrinibacteria bacterium]
MHKLSDYNFDLPESFIAQKPLDDRDASKLMILDRKNPRKLLHKKVSDLTEILDKNDVLVFNSSRVIPARITGDFGEILLSKPIPLEKKISPNPSLEKRGICTWQCLTKPGRKFKVGKIIDLPEGMKAEVVKVNQDGTRDIFFSRLLRRCTPRNDQPLSLRGNDSDRSSLAPLHEKNSSLREESKAIQSLDATNLFLSWLQRNGEIPQPPYIKEKIKDSERYQTTFSKKGKSVAAPTAGLHFTPELIKKLDQKGIEIHKVHLDVGLGTFLPVKTDDIREHKMHSEFFELDEETAKALNTAKKNGKRIIAVGTTSIRVLESCSDDTGILRPKYGETNIFIYPGYDFKFVDAIFTNFHTPSSTLLMLISAFAGKENIFHAYSEAKKNNYRFFSLGDAMLIR